MYYIFTYITYSQKLLKEISLQGPFLADIEERLCLMWVL